jgi:hypothetical protein
MSGFTREVAVVRDGFATPFAGNDPASGTFRGCLYTAEGTRLALSVRPWGPGYGFRPGDPETLDPGTVEAVPRLPGRTLYLGQYFAHYGHFLTETLSTFWALEAEPAARFDRIAFHPSAFGRRLTPYARAALAAFDIDPDAVVMLDEGPRRFEEVVVPERLFRLWDAADPGLRPVYARIRARTLAGRAPEPPRALYLTRRGSYWRRSVRRVVANEARVEELFRRRGFAILDPTALSFADQLALYASAPTLAGLSGSALHNCLFQDPGARVIELEHPEIYREVGTRPAHTQDLCNAVAGVEGRFVPFTGRSRRGGAVLHLDLAAIEAALPPASAPPALLRRRAAAALEAAALDRLPPLRAAAGRLLARPSRPRARYR